MRENNNTGGANSYDSIVRQKLTRARIYFFLSLAGLAASIGLATVTLPPLNNAANTLRQSPNGEIGDLSYYILKNQVPGGVPKSDVKEAQEKLARYSEKERKDYEEAKVSYMINVAPILIELCGGAIAILGIVMNGAELVPTNTDRTPSSNKRNKSKK